MKFMDSVRSFLSNGTYVIAYSMHKKLSIHLNETDVCLFFNPELLIIHSTSNKFINILREILNNIF